MKRARYSADCSPRQDLHVKSMLVNAHEALELLRLQIST
jgi:hypothetical protein